MCASLLAGCSRVVGKHGAPEAASGERSAADDGPGGSAAVIHGDRGDCPRHALSR